MTTIMKTDDPIADFHIWDSIQDQTEYVECNHCGGDTDPEDLKACVEPDCGKQYCKKCMYVCPGCGELVCPECADKDGKCKQCSTENKEMLC